MIIKREDQGKVISIIKRFNPNAFYSVEETKSVSDGVFPQKKAGILFNYRIRSDFSGKGSEPGIIRFSR